MPEMFKQFMEPQEPVKPEIFAESAEEKETKENLAAEKVETEIEKLAENLYAPQTTMDKIRRATAKKTSCALLGLSMLAFLSVFPKEAVAEEGSSSKQEAPVEERVQGGEIDPFLQKVGDIFIWLRHDDATMRKREGALRRYENQRRARERREEAEIRRRERRAGDFDREIDRIKKGYDRQRRVLGQD